MDVIFNFLLTVAALVVSVGLYFLPTIIALVRKKRSSGAIMVFNLIVFGFLMTLGLIGSIGWIILIIWSLLPDKEF
ncbi:superinfection immunity protein [Salicibibacter cibarius]|nr:superinfection immunity protein [Salicibibacter cibarius]